MNKNALEADYLGLAIDWIARYVPDGLKMLKGDIEPCFDDLTLENTFVNAQHSKHKRNRAFDRYMNPLNGQKAFINDLSIVSFSDIVVTIQGMKKNSFFSKEWDVYELYHSLWGLPLGRLAHSVRITTANYCGVSIPTVDAVIFRFPRAIALATIQGLFLEKGIFTKVGADDRESADWID